MFDGPVSWGRTRSVGDFASAMVGTAAPAPPSRPEPPMVEQMLQRLLMVTQARQPVPVSEAGILTWKPSCEVCFPGI